MVREIPEDVIIPPVSIQETILKTARYVHKNGSTFEEQILKSDSIDKFGFLRTEDDYYEYYKYVLEHIEEFDDNIDGDGQLNGDESDETADNLEKPEDLPFLIDIEYSITEKDLNVIKTTALFVSNNQNVLNEIKNKYGTLGQFGFLNYDHTLHKLFLKYLKSYKLLNDDSYEYKLKTDIDELIDTGFKRAEYEEFYKQKVKNEEKIETLKKDYYLSINWQDFNVSEIIEFTDLDKITEFSEPYKIEDLKFRSLEKKSRQVKEYKVSSSNKNAINIKEFGTTRRKFDNKDNSNDEKLVECPITGEMIQESEFEKHIQILLRDPNYQVERERYESKIKNSNLSTDQVIENIKGLFKKSSEPPTKKQKVQCDGYKSSINYVKQQNKR